MRSRTVGPGAVWALKEKVPNDNSSALCYNLPMNRISAWTRRLFLIGFMLLLAWGVAAARPLAPPQAYLPLVIAPPTELRGLWVSRFDWTGWNNPGSASAIDDIVAKAAGANFNVILFQVRGTADAFYTPGLEPWSDRLNIGRVLGQDPGWDPLAHMVSSAHAAGLQVHAYINVYPAWYGEAAPADGTNPRHPFWTWTYWPDTSWADWRHWDQDGPMNLNPSYLFASPAAPMVADHVLDVAKDIVNRYAVDGLHLDYIRYAGPQYSCDPFTVQNSPSDCYTSGWEDWQRDQISNLVESIYQDPAIPPDVMLSAAVWPVYERPAGWPTHLKEGRNDYYQDSQAWVQSGIIDAIMPMIYPANYNCPDDSFWTQSVWETLATDFQANSGGRQIVTGIGGGYCTFDEIVWRIEKGRSLGTAGHAIFSYSLLDGQGHWDKFTAPGGPHEEPARVPATTWRP